MPEKVRPARRDAKPSQSLLPLPLILAALAAAFVQCSSAPAGDARNPSAPAAVGRECATRYPILLVHGVSWRDDYPIPYWDSVPEALEAHGARVYLAKHDAWGTIEGNAAKIAQRIDAILSETGAGKVNLVAHSKGGIESRYLISSLGRGGQVASLSTINTPHRGSASARFFLKDAPVVNGVTGKAVDLTALFILGDRDPDAKKAVWQLTPEFMAEFNAANPDDPRVLYQSWTSVLDDSYGVPLYQAFYMLLRDLEGPNDGFVSVSSAQWGDFRGVIGAEEGIPISHSDVHGLILFPAANRFNAPAFYVALVSELKDRGF
jgi:triacylglycerol lipase